MTVITVPARFYDDHTGRGLPSGTELSRSSRGIAVDLDEASWRDLLADAEFYVEMGVSEFGAEHLGLISSAQATVKRMKALCAAHAPVQAPAGDPERAPARRETSRTTSGSATQTARK